LLLGERREVWRDLEGQWEKERGMRKVADWDCGLRVARFALWGGWFALPWSEVSVF